MNLSFGSSSSGLIYEECVSSEVFELILMGKKKVFIKNFIAIKNLGFKVEDYIEFTEISDRETSKLSGRKLFCKITDSELVLCDENFNIRAYSLQVIEGINI